MLYCHTRLLLGITPIGARCYTYYYQASPPLGNRSSLALFFRLESSGFRQVLNWSMVTLETQAGVGSIKFARSPSSGDHCPSALPPLTDHASSSHSLKQTRIRRYSQDQVHPVPPSCRPTPLDTPRPPSPLSVMHVTSLSTTPVTTPSTTPVTAPANPAPTLALPTTATLPWTTRPGEAAVAAPSSEPTTSGSGNTASQITVNIPHYSSQP